MKVMVGGTFDPLHDGHKKLIARSFEIAGSEGTVIIGLTTDSFAGRKHHLIRSYEQREADLMQFIRDAEFDSRWLIEPLNDPFGRTLEEEFDALVVSEETLAVAMDINSLRRKKGMRKVDVHQISCVLAEDGRWISSTRIYRGEIDRHGRLIR